MKVVIYGGSGFIGAWITKLLLVNNFQITIFDKKINEVANDHLDGLEDSLKHMDLDTIRSEVNKMLDDCDMNELQKIAKMLANMARKSFQDE